MKSSLDVKSAEFKANKKELEARLEEVQAIRAKSHGSGKAAKPGKLLPRERIELLLDSGKPFLELCTLAGYRMHDDEDGSFAGGGIIAGIGFVEGVRCLVVANNYVVKGGTISPAGLKKMLRLHQIALENRLPLVTLAESGGANLNYAAEVYVEGARAFANQARLSAAGIPQITIVHGNATAGGAYQPGLSDYIILIEDQSKMFLAGPPLVKAAIGQTATDEELGGARMHAKVSGTGEFLAKDDKHAIKIARKVINDLGWNEPQLLPPLPKPAKFSEPAFDSSELMGIIPTNPKKPFDMRDIIARIVDATGFDEFKLEYDSQTVCGRARIQGKVCGIVCNNGPITAKGAGKAAQFIESCEQTRTPIIFMHNTTGFMVGTDAEQSGIIRQGAKMIQAVANATVPKISIIVGGSFGAGNYAMCGRGFDPTFIFCWPSARTAVMGGEQAGKVLRMVSEEKAKKTGQAIEPAKLDALEKKTSEQLDRASTALFSTASLWDDGIIDPRETRNVLGLLLDTCLEAELRKLARNTFGLKRH